jgi:hypothetical protein
MWSGIFITCRVKNEAADPQGDYICTHQLSFNRYCSRLLHDPMSCFQGIEGSNIAADLCALGAKET